MTALRRRLNASRWDIDLRGSRISEGVRGDRRGRLALGLAKACNGWRMQQNHTTSEDSRRPLPDDPHKLRYVIRFTRRVSLVFFACQPKSYFAESMFVTPYHPWEEFEGVSSGPPTISRRGQIERRDIGYRAYGCLTKRAPVVVISRSAGCDDYSELVVPSVFSRSDGWRGW